MEMVRLSVLWLALMVAPALAGKVLVLMPFPAYSHTMPFMPIFKELGKRGHEVTMVTPFPQDPLPKGFKQFNVDLNLDTITKIMWNHTRKGPNIRQPNSHMFESLGLWKICPALTKVLLEKTKPHLPPPGTKFDLLVAEPFFCMEPLLAYSKLYNAPVVATLPLPISSSIAKVTGNPLSWAYVPIQTLRFTDKMTFFERFRNTVVGVADLLTNYLIHFPKQDALMREFLGDPQFPSVVELTKNISLVLTEAHYTLNYPRAYHRNVLEVGGVGIEGNYSLPKELEGFVKDANNGLILFSWGSHFHVEGEEEFFQILMKTFARLKQKVIFKWNHPIPNKPDNVYIMDWVPQRAILAHKKTVLFISHCGLNSLHEATYFGVPVLGTPVFGDQPHNTKILENAGMGIHMSVDQIEDGTDAFYRTINELISNPKYKQNALKRQAIVRDHPMPILDEAIYWLEYLMRHDGAKHLRPASMDIPWYTMALIDVFLFIALLITLPFVIIGYLLRKWLSQTPKTTASNGVTQRKKKN